ncbi:MAG: YtxH domain-containing protein [Erysipelotrichaceae bacterium]|nr:YtxH domain-containing protein [Erysipelotrichaceae bacterium]
MSKKSGFGKFLAGIGIGAGLGILLAPKSGKETREDLKKMLEKFVEEVKNIDVNEVKDEFLKKVDEIKTEIEELDKEKVAKIAKEKAEDLKKKANELVELAKEKGTPVLENAANDVRQKAINVTKDVLKKLENKA